MFKWLLRRKKPVEDVLPEAEIRLIAKWRERGGSEWWAPEGSPLAKSGWNRVRIERIGYARRPATRPPDLSIWTVNLSTGETQVFDAQNFDDYFEPAPCLPSSTSNQTYEHV